MFGENGQMVDMDEVREAIVRADVLIVGFRGFAERLLIDSRSAADTGSMTRVVEPLGGVEERMHWLGRNRPQFGMPQRFTFFVWPHSVGFLEESSVVNAMYASAGEGAGAAQLSTALEELQVLERVANRSAIDGDQWRSLWDAQGSRRGR